MIIKTTDQTGVKYLAWADPGKASLMWVHNKSKAQDYPEEQAKKLVEWITDGLHVTCNAEPA